MAPKKDSHGNNVPAPTKTPLPPQPPRQGKAPTPTHLLAIDNTPPTTTHDLHVTDTHELKVDPTPPPTVFPDAKSMQAYLKTLGVDLGNSGPNHDGVDGVVGPKTLAGAKRFGLSVTAPPAAPATPQVKAAPGNSAPSTAPATTAGGVNIDAVVAQMKQQYGYLGALLDKPDVRAVLIDLITKGTPPGDASVVPALMSTQTMQGLSQNQVGFDVATPGAKTDLISRASDSIIAESKKLGIDIAPERVQQMAHDAARNGWAASSVEFKNLVAAEFHYAPGGQKGAIGTAESTMRQLAANYFLPVSDGTLSNFDQQIAAGTMTAEDFRQYAIAQAKSLYKSPQVDSLLDKGMTMDQIADPYRQDAAQVLGTNPDSIDFTKPQWLKALSYTDPKTGQTGMMTRFDWQHTLRTDPQYGWDRTQNGIQAGYDVRNALAGAFGVA